jgi:uncharacterized cupin superfamily protein
MTESAAMSATTSRVLSVSRGEVELEDHPINPDWVLEGNPRARISQWAESEDGFVSHWTWDCTAGRFRWYYDVDETIVIITGSVSIQVDDEPPVPLQVGDAAYFAAGHWVTWTVPDYVRKQAVVRVPVPRTMRYVAKGFGRRAHRLRNAAP